MEKSLKILSVFALIDAANLITMQKNKDNFIA